MNVLFHHVILLLFETILSLEMTTNYEQNMIIDVVNSWYKPTILSINVCWNLKKKRDFILKLKNAPRVVHFVDNIDDLKETSVKSNIFIVSDGTCFKSTGFFGKAHKFKKFSAPYRWLIISNQSYNESDSVPLIQKLNLLTDSDIILAELDNNVFTLRMPYKIRAGNSEWIWEEFGIWTPNKRLQKTSKMNIPTAMRRKDLGGIAIATSHVIINNRSKMELSSLKNIHIDTLAKIGYRQIRHLYDFMNATNVNIFSDTWGYFINGTWTGMIGNIVRGEAELTGTVSFLTTQRLKVLDFLSYPSPPTARFVFREPSLSYQNNLFLLPFKPIVWICIFCLIMLLAVILFINVKWEKKKLTNDSPDETRLRPNVSDIAIMIIGAISQQGSSTELKGTLGRAVMFLLFIAFVFLYTSYSANIVVLLQSTSNQIKTLTDLYNSKLELGTEDTPYNRYLFSTATEPIRMAIYKNKIAPRENFLSLDEGVKKLQTQPFAFNMNLGTGYKAIENYFYEHEKCGLQEIEYIQENKPWQGCRKNSPYKEIYKIGLLRIQEHGLNDRENRLVYAKKPVCSVRGGSFASVNMIDFHPALLMLFYGMILSCVLFLLEVLHYRRARNCNTHRD